MFRVYAFKRREFVLEDMDYFVRAIRQLLDRDQFYGPFKDGSYDDGYVVRMTLPADLSEREAERLATFVKTLVFT